MNTPTQQCSKCNETKDLTEYAVRSDSGKPKGVCKACEHIRNSRPEFRERCRVLAKQRRANNKEHYQKLDRARNLRTKPSRLLSAAKLRAKNRGHDFNIDISDVIIPEFCPILGIKIQPSKDVQGTSPCSPSVDRINNDFGYVKGNVRVISYRANSLKSDGKLAEFMAIVEDLKKHNCP